jgi:DNA modification methylase
MTNIVEKSTTFNDILNSSSTNILDTNITKPKFNITKKSKKDDNISSVSIINEPKAQINQVVSILPSIQTFNNPTVKLEIKNSDGLEYLKTIEPNSVDLILTDPPYIISRDSGMNTHYENVKKNTAEGVEYVKTDVEWQEYKAEHPELTNDDKKENYMKYGTIYGKKYCVKTQYGDWDENFTMDKLEQFISEYYRKLRKGGTLIIWFDLWKITDLKNLLEKYKFKQLRFIEWIKTNPQPLNSSTNYLTNCREIALVCVKDGKPVFNSKYDNGIYNHPLQGGKNRFHPTQKSLALFEELIKKHSNENAIVLDTFLGGGTTAIACKNTNRQFKGCEISKEYYEKILKIIADDST